jgi:amino acid transporter
MLQSGLAVMGAIFRNTVLTGIATELSRNTWWWFIGGLLSLVINLVIVSISRRLGRIWLYVMVTLPLIGGLMTIIVLLTANPTMSASLWDSAFGLGAYREIVSAAIAAGWKSDLLAPNPAMTATVVPICILAWTGAGIVGTFIAGETKRPTLSMFVGTVGAGLFIFIYQLIYVGGILKAYGLEWVSQFNYAMAKGALSINPKLTPSVPLMAAVLAYGISPVALFVGINGFLMTLKSPVSFYYSGSRILFAMAFDRMMPSKFAELHSRTGTPIWNYVFTFILSTIFCYITTPASGLGPYVALWVGFTLAGWMFIFACLAAAIFPFVRRDIYEIAGKPVTWKVLGVPVISVMGIIGFIGWMYAFINNAYTLVVRGGWFGALIPPIELALMLAVFLAFAAYNAKRGVDITLAYKEIPPE